MGANEAALSQGHPLPDPAGGHQVQSLRQGLGGPHAALPLGQPHVQLDPAGQGVADTVQIGAAVPHVAPVALQGDAVEGRSLLEQGREEILSKIPRLVGRDPFHGGGGQNIDAGVDLIGEHLAPGRLFHKTLYPAVLAGQDQSVLQRALVAVEAQGGLSPALLMKADQPGQVQIADAVPADHQKVLLPQMVRAVFHTARRSHGLLLDEIGQPHPQLLPAAEAVHHRLRLVAQGDADIGDPVVLQQADDVLHHRPAQQRGHGLGRAQRQRPQPGALPARHNDSFQTVRHPSIVHGG